MTEIIKATENEIPIIEDILIDVVHWLDSTNQSLWNEEQVKWTRLSNDFKISDFFIAKFDGDLVACMAITDYDPFFWSNIEKGESLFIHKLAVKRCAAGKGLSDLLINYAKSICKDRGIAKIRLDCSQDRPKLRAVYERHGFYCVDERVVFEKYPTAFYECDV